MTYALLCVHPCLRCNAHKAGAAANQRDADKQRQYANGSIAAYRSEPVTVETHGQLGQLFMDLLAHIGDQAAASHDGLATKAGFMTQVLQDLNVCMHKFNLRVMQAVPDSLRTLAAHTGCMGPPGCS
jgi:hypothetical protein